MKVITKKKIYNGLVEIRDYERDRFVRLKQPLKIIVGKEFMILSLAQLKTGKVTNTQHSIFNEGQMYKLIGWRWNPTGVIEEQLSIPLDIRAKLFERFKQKTK